MPFAFPGRRGKIAGSPLSPAHRGKAPITIRQDVSLYAAAITGGKSLEFHVFPGRQAYLVVIEGEAELGGVSLSARDAAEIGPDLVRITAKSASHLLRFDMSSA